MGVLVRAQYSCSVSGLGSGFIQRLRVIQCLDFRIKATAFRVWGVGLRMCVSGLRIHDLGFRVKGLAFGVQDFGLRVKGLRF